MVLSLPRAASQARVGFGATPQGVEVLLSFSLCAARRSLDLDGVYKRAARQPRLRGLVLFELPAQRYECF